MYTKNGFGVINENYECVFIFNPTFCNTKIAPIIIKNFLNQLNKEKTSAPFKKVKFNSYTGGYINLIINDLLIGCIQEPHAKEILKLLQYE